MCGVLSTSGPGRPPGRAEAVAVHQDWAQHREIVRGTGGVGGSSGVVVVANAFPLAGCCGCRAGALVLSGRDGVQLELLAPSSPKSPWAPLLLLPLLPLSAPTRLSSACSLALVRSASTRWSTPSSPPMLLPLAWWCGTGGSTMLLPARSATATFLTCLRRSARSNRRWSIPLPTGCPPPPRRKQPQRDRKNAGSSGPDASPPPTRADGGVGVAPPLQKARAGHDHARARLPFATPRRDCSRAGCTATPVPTLC